MLQPDRAGLLAALGGFCMFAIGDSIIKGMTDLWPPTALAAMRFVLGAIVLSSVLAVREGNLRAVFVMTRPGLQWVRGGSVAIGAICMFTALWLMPLGEATTITFMHPLITAVLAMIILNEKLRTGVIIATLVAFAGVIIVMRPSIAEIGIVAALPLGTALCMSVLMIANRKVAGTASALAMQVYISNCAAVTLIVATIIGHFSGIEHLAVNWPPWHVLARCGVVAVTASLAHWLVYLGTVRAGAATVAPMAYGQLLTAVVVGWIVFDEVPDALTLIGGAVIVGAGLWIWHLGRSNQPSPGTG